MFSRGKLLLRLSSFQNAFYRCQCHTTDFDYHLMTVANSSPKQCYSLLFFDEKVQEILKKLTHIDFKTVFKPKPMGRNTAQSVYKLLTDEQVKEEMKRAEATADYLLQIPPLVNVTEDNIQILDSDTSLDGYDKHHSKYVFVDTSFEEKNETRAVVVREPNGVLRTAFKNERFRVNQIYNPLKGREIETPEMFETNNLMNVIKRKEYEYILDRACIQFEPDEMDYHKVISLTYEAINYCKDFDMLHSTRHFGSLVFYLISHKNIDQILDDNLKKDRIDDASLLVKLYHIIHPECKSAELCSDKNNIEILKDFIKFDTKIPGILNNSLEECLKREQRKSDLKSGIKEAHGF